MPFGPGRRRPGRLARSWPGTGETMDRPRPWVADLAVGLVGWRRKAGKCVACLALLVTDLVRPAPQLSACRTPGRIAGAAKLGLWKPIAFSFTRWTTSHAGRPRPTSMRC